MNTIRNFDNFYTPVRIFLAGLLLILLLTGCTAPPRPHQVDNLCGIFKEYPAWYTDTQKSARRWGVPAAVQMSIMYQESSFDGEAKPPRTKLFWIIPWSRPSSAYGYSQALDGTWDEYKHDTHHYFANRNSFADATDFMGWYLNETYRHTKIPKYDAYALYLAYHDGWTGYNRGTYRSKPWLMAVARRVQYRATMYQRQLNVCRESLERQKKWYQ